MIDGVRYLGKGFSLLIKPRILPYVIIPTLINLLIFLGFIRYAYHATNIARYWLDAHLPQWLHWLDSLLWLLFVVGILFFFVYIFTTVANMVAAPFNGLLSEKVEELVSGEKLKDPLSLKALIALLPKTLARQLQLLFYFIPRAAIVLILFFIPGVNLVAGIVWFLFSAWMMSIQYLDYPFDNHHIPFKNMTHRMRKQWWSHMNFGIIISVLSIIPLVNLIIMPAAVAGATVLWIEKHRAHS